MSIVVHVNPDETVMFPLDDDDIMTDLDHQPWAGGSHVGLVPVVQEDEEALSRAIERLEATCLTFDSVDPSAAAAELSLRRRTGRLAMLAKALRHVCAYASSPVHRELFLNGSGLLEPYVSSVHMWASDVTETLEVLADELNALAPDWAAFRESLQNAEWVYARAAGEQSHLAGIAETLPPDVRAALGELFVALRTFKRSLDEAFG